MADAAQLPVVCLLDGDELADVREILEQMGVEIFEPAGPDAASLPAAAPVLISSLQRAVAMARSGASPAGTERPWHIAVCDLRASRRLSFAGACCDFLLQRPVQATTLCLLLRRAAHTGPERRQRRRFSIGETVRLEAGRKTHPVTLAQLSGCGCGLVARDAIDPGSDVRILLPPKLTGSGRLVVEGRVLASTPSQLGGASRFDIAVRFRPLGGEGKRALATLVQRGCELAPLRGSEGPASSGAAPAQPPPEAASAEATTGERRTHPRKTYRNPLLAVGPDGARTLVAVDLSVEAMRVQPDPQLVVGKEFKLAIHRNDGGPPILVRAAVTRDDGADGCVLHFRQIKAGAAAKLEALVASLPRDVRGKRGDQRTGLVVSEIVD